MASDTNALLPQAFKTGEGLVGDKETEGKTVPWTPLRRGINWSEILDRLGLESPGYLETIEKMYQDGKINRKK